MSDAEVIARVKRFLVLHGDCTPGGYSDRIHTYYLHSGLDPVHLLSTDVRRLVALAESQQRLVGIAQHPNAPAEWRVVGPASLDGARIGEVIDLTQGEPNA